MQSSVSLNSTITNLQRITAYQNRKQRFAVVVNGVCYLMEYGLYTLLFVMLFKWKISGEVWIHYWYLVTFILSLFTVLSVARGLGRLKNNFGWVEELFQTAVVVFYTFMTTIGILFLMKISDQYSRTILILFMGGMLFIAWTVRLTKRAVLAALAQKEILTENVLIIGAGKVGKHLSDWLCVSNAHGYRVVGFVDDHVVGPDVKGDLSQLGEIIRNCNVDVIIITIPSERSLVNRILKDVHQFRVRVKIVPELYDLVTTKIAFDRMDRFPFIEVVENRHKLRFAITKRTMDFVLALVGIVVLFPILLVLSALIKMDSPGPAVFKQKRTGKDGKPFTIYKFRSMVSNAEQRLKADPVLYDKYIANNYKLEQHEDPRITKLGRFLRKTSLDELPQLFNVLRGDMSLVGPRPVVNDELREYKDRLSDLLSVKPGVTGYWQVSGRSGVGYPERVDVELYYVFNQSALLDVKILLKTVVTVLRRDGAY